MKIKMISFLAITASLLLTGCQRPNNNGQDNQSNKTSEKTSNNSGSEYEYSPTSYSYESETAKKYYSSIGDNLTGSTLRKALEDLCYGSFNKTPSSLSYSSVKNYFAGAYRSPKNSNDMVLYYTDKSGNSTSWNKEHIWPNSRGTGDGSGPCGDPWVIAPCDSSDNSSRGNNVYGLVSGSYDPGTGADGALLKYRGIAARAILYTATTWWHHPGKNSAPLELNESTSYSSGANKMGILSQLLKWNLEYPIDETETIRNEYIYKALGVRNPFVDNRNFGCRIWGNDNAETRKVCSGQYDGGSDSHEEVEQDTPVTSPVVNHNYKLGMFQKGLNQQLYITGNIANEYYGETTNIKSNAANIKLEASGDGYYIKVGSNKYLNLVTSGTHNNVSFSTSPTSIWTFNTTYNTFVTTGANGQCYIGSSKEYNTLSASLMSYITYSNSYPAHLYEV